MFHVPSGRLMGALTAARKPAQLVNSGVHGLLLKSEGGIKKEEENHPS